MLNYRFINTMIIVEVIRSIMAIAQLNATIMIHIRFIAIMITAIKIFHISRLKIKHQRWLQVHLKPNQVSFRLITKKNLN